MRHWLTYNYNHQLYNLNTIQWPWRPWFVVKGVGLSAQGLSVVTKVLFSERHAVKMVRSSSPDVTASWLTRCIIHDKKYNMYTQHLVKVAWYSIFDGIYNMYGQIWLMLTVDLGFCVISIKIWKVNAHEKVVNVHHIFAYVCTFHFRMTILHNLFTKSDIGYAVFKAAASDIRSPLILNNMRVELKKLLSSTS